MDRLLKKDYDETYRSANPDWMREYNLKRYKHYRDTHREQVRERSRKWKEENKERLKAYQKEYYLKRKAKRLGGAEQVKSYIADTRAEAMTVASIRNGKITVVDRKYVVTWKEIR